MEDKNENKEKEKKENNRMNIMVVGIIVITIIMFLIIIGVIAIEMFEEEECKNTNNIKSNNQGLIQRMDKPIIYLYPKEQIEITVKLGYAEKVTCSYPKYNDSGWRVIANPDGTLVDIETKRELYSLYWEGKELSAIDMSEGFVIKGEDTIEFLEEKLEILGLNAREAEEFIIYWLPKMQNNKYNYIRFATKEEIEEYMPLEFSTEPDSLIRVLMQYKPLDEYIEVKEQKLETPKREGFVVVEWGGSEISK